MPPVPENGQFPLPIDDALPTLCEALAQQQSVVLSAPPGSGKTTRVPLALLDAGFGNHGLILMLEPRRVAARSVASFMSTMLKEPVGQTVGYQVRMENRMGSQTRVLVVTEGILTRKCLGDPLLEDVACVIIDEFHERSVHVDLALCLLKETMTVRDDLKVIVMSATIHTGEVSAYLNDCPVISVDGAPFPLRVEHATERLDLLHGNQLAKVTASAIVRALDENKAGDVLAFLPGAGDIEITRNLLQRRLTGAVEIVPLYGALPAAQQDDAVRGGSKRRVVLATNIAETSLTIPNVRIVVDAGLEKRVEWRSGIGFEKLVTGRISKFSAVQRAGRAARTGPGVVYRLWHGSQEKELAPSSLPEIARRDPVATVFTLVAAFCKTPAEIDLLESLRPAVVADAMETLQLLGLVNASGNGLTNLGKLAIQLPIHPRLALAIIASVGFGMAKTGATAAAIIEERPVLTDRGLIDSMHGERCDIEMRLQMLETFIERHMTRDAAAALGLNYMVCRRILERREQLMKMARSLSVATVAETGDGKPTSLSTVLLYGFWDRLCKKEDAKSPTGVMATGRGVAVGPNSVVRSSQYFLAIDAVSDSHRSRQRSEVTLASGISPETVEAKGARFFRSDTELVLDDVGKAVAYERTRYMALLWRQKRLKNVPRGLQTKLLATRALADWESVILADEKQRNALGRLALAAHLFPELSIPPVSADGMADIITSQCEFSADMTALKKIDWARQIIQLMPYEQQRQLENRLPTTLSLPSGRRTSVNYARWLDEKTGPMIRVRLQELFGLQETPSIADGKVSLSIALLAPNGREVQITNDLKSFWENTYPEVRRELRARYAKHFWPEDPSDAVATHLTQKQFQRRKQK